MKKLIVKTLSLILTLSFALPGFAMASETTFEDVKSSDWYYESVCFAKEKGWVNGFEDGTFKPNDTLTKAQAISVVARAAGLDIPETNGAWYEGAFQVAKEKTMVYTDLKMNEPIEREQVFYMIYNGFDFKSIDAAVRNEETPFEDLVITTGALVNIYSSIIPTLYTFGLVSGYEENGKMYVKPNGFLTRAEMCTILKSVYEFNIEKWIAERDLFSDEVAKKYLLEMIEKGDSECVMYSYGKSTTEVSARIKQVGKMCFELYEDKYPKYFKNYSWSCGSYLMSSDNTNFIKATVEMRK